jgi:hypothetical protein
VPYAGFSQNKPSINMQQIEDKHKEMTHAFSQNTTDVYNEQTFIR